MCPKVHIEMKQERTIMKGIKYLHPIESLQELLLEETTENKDTFLTPG